MNGNGNSQYLGCAINGFPVAIPVANVQEVFETRFLAKVPKCPAFIAGLVNIRGAIVPVLDLWQVEREGADLFTMAVLSTAEGNVGLLISRLDDLVRFTRIGPADALPSELAVAPFSGAGLDESGKMYFVLDAEQCIAGTIPRE